MKLRFLLLACLSTVAIGQQAPKTVGDSMNFMFGILTDEFVSAADAMPESKWSFAPTSGEFKGVRTFADEVKHTACANEGFAAEIEGKTPPEHCEVGGGPSPAKTKAEIMQYLRDSFAHMQRLIAITTPENILQPAHGPYGGPNTRIGLIGVALWHGGDHYGQIVEYLRMNGIVPPGSRPSAQNSETAPKRVRLAEDVLTPVRKVTAEYPFAARRGRIQGQVRMAILIGVEGSVKTVQLISGHPTLAQAAMDAVKQWKYKPFAIAGTPVEVETTVTTNFTIN